MSSHAKDLAVYANVLLLVLLKNESWLFVSVLRTIKLVLETPGASVCTSDLHWRPSFVLKHCQLTFFCLA